MSEVVIFGSRPSLTGRSLGLYRLASHLRQQGHATRCLLAWSELPDNVWNSMARYYINANTKIVGVSVTVMSRTLPTNELLFFGISDETFQKRCALIKHLAPNCLLVVGGAEMRYANKGWLKNFTTVDYFVTGQGEAILSHLVDAHSHGQRPKLPDITKPYVVDDSSMPYNDFVFSSTEFVDEDGVSFNEPLPLELARGCIFKCSYCSYELTGKSHEDFIRHFEPVRRDLISNYERFGTTSYYLADDLINESDHKINLIYEIAQSLPFALDLQGYVRLDLVRRFPHQFQKLLDSGLQAAFFGIETVNDRSGRAVGKGLGKKK